MAKKFGKLLLFGAVATAAAAAAYHYLQRQEVTEKAGKEPAEKAEKAEKEPEEDYFDDEDYDAPSDITLFQDDDLDDDFDASDLDLEDEIKPAEKAFAPLSEAILQEENVEEFFDEEEEE